MNQFLCGANKDNQVSAINDVTREKIKGYLESFIDRVIENNQRRKIQSFESSASYLAKVASKPKLKPFHAAIIPPQIMAINEFERSFSTTLGTTFEEAARLIALDHHAEVHRSHEIWGEADQNALKEIENQIAVFEHAAYENNERPSLSDMVSAVLSAHVDNDNTARSARSDLFIRTHTGLEYYFEIKSPVPNKDQCLSITSRILRIHLLRRQSRPNVQAYFAMAYNPYGPTRGDYRWSLAKLYLPFEQATLIGQEFWEIVGGPTTYQELLNIYAEVGRDKSKRIFESMGL